MTLLSDMISDLNLTDMETGMKGFVREKLMTLKLNANRFTFEPEITAKAARADGASTKSQFPIRDGLMKRARKSASATR